MSTFLYCLKQGVINICRNIWFSLASVATISACIFLFCLFFSMVANVQHGARTAEETVGISVFFDEGMEEGKIQAIGEQIRGWSEVREAKYISASEAWESFKKEYFEGMEELADGFEADNPLANSASYEIYLKDISNQDMIVKHLEAIEGVRKVRYSSGLVAGFTSAGKMIGALSAVIIGVLLAVAVFLICHTIEGKLIQFVASTTNPDVIYWGSTYLKVDMSFIVICGVIVILRNSMQGFGDRVIPVFSSCIELAGKIIFAFVFAPMFAYWGIIWAEPMVWIAMVIPLIVKVVHVLKKEA